MTINLILLKDIIILIASLITALGIICSFMKKYFDKMANKITKPILEKTDDIMKRIDKMDKDQCMRYLTEFLADVRNNVDKDQYQLAMAHDVYTHYAKDLKGNSYIHRQWDKYMNGKEAK